VVKGIVDEFGRALATVVVRHSNARPQSAIDVWIDTGFTGELIVPRGIIQSLALPVTRSVLGVLADGSQHEIEAFQCELEWFGKWITVEVLANDGQFPLLGVGLLRDHELRVDYIHRVSEIV
jgi:clan AA aspartic protease